MSLSSRPPVPARTAGSSGALSDALSAFSLSSFSNNLVSTGLVVGLAQYLDVDRYFASNPGENSLVAAGKETLWVVGTSQLAAMARIAVPALRVFG